MTDTYRCHCNGLIVGLNNVDRPGDKYICLKCDSVYDKEQLVKEGFK